MPTTPTTDPMAPVEPITTPPTRPFVPTFDQILRLRPGERCVFRGVDWEFYERVHEVVGERGWLRIAFDGRDLEIMPTSAYHDGVKGFSFRFVEILTEELEIDMASTGSTTWARPDVRRGIEADESYYFAPAKVAMYATAMARGSTDLADYPNPDLAVEIDISDPQIDRPGIYAALRVPEIWRFSETGAIIDRLNAQGTYEDAGRSAFLPITADEVARWVLHEDRSNLQDWRRRLRAWIRAELADRRAVP